MGGDAKYLSMTEIGYLVDPVAHNWIHPDISLKQTNDAAECRWSVVATDNIPALTTILRSYPKLCTPKGVPSAQVAETLALHKPRFLYDLLDCLAPRKSSPLMDLPEEKQIRRITKKLITNQFDARNPRYSTILHDDVSYFNHSCCPNASHYSDPSEVMQVFTLMPVAAGDELCISYNAIFPINSLDIRSKEVQQILKRPCRCDACSRDLPPSLWNYGHLTQHCWWCGKPTTENQCPVCQHAFYCDGICQAADYTTHSKQCGRLSEQEPNFKVISRFNSTRDSRQPLYTDIVDRVVYSDHSRKSPEMPDLTTAMQNSSIDIKSPGKD